MESTIIPSNTPIIQLLFDQFDEEITKFPANELFF